MGAPRQSNRDALICFSKGEPPMMTRLVPNIFYRQLNDGLDLAREFAVRDKTDVCVMFRQF